MNRKVWILTEMQDFCIGTVGQVLLADAKIRSLQEALQDVVRGMIEDECYDDNSIEFTIEIR